MNFLGFGQSRPPRDPEPQRVSIPLATAFLCEACKQIIPGASRGCPVCGSHAVIAMTRLFALAKERARQKATVVVVGKLRPLPPVA